MADPLPLPKILVYHTKTAGWQVRYLSASGRTSIRLRRLDFQDAIMRGAAAARVHDVPLEVDP